MISECKKYIYDICWASVQSLLTLYHAYNHTIELVLYETGYVVMVECDLTEEHTCTVYISLFKTPDSNPRQHTFIGVHGTSK